MATVEEIKKNRKIHRMLCSTSVKKIEKVISLGKPDMQTKIIYDSFRTNVEKLFKIDDDLKIAVLSGATNEEDMLQILDIEETLNRNTQYNLLLAKCELILSKFFNPKSTDVDNDDNENVEKKLSRRKFNLPVLELKQFDGKIENWIGFWGQFHKIHEDSSIDDDDKFQYLLKATEPGTSARELIESFPPSGFNYHKAIEDLKTRFAKDEVIIKHYIRKLLELVLYQNSHKGNLELRRLYDKLNTQLRALESLGVASDKYAAMLYPLIESAIPEDTLRVWERTTKNKSKDELQQLMEFLKTEVECEEKVQLAKNSFNEGTTYSKQPTACIVATNNSKTHNKVTNFDKTSTSTMEKIFPCIWCEKSTHKSSECVRTRDMTLEQKKDYLKSKKACLICLRIGHYANKCRSYPKCLHCTKRHTIIMCPNMNIQREVPSVASSSKETNITCHNKLAQEKEVLGELTQGIYICHKNFTTLLQTIFVNICYNDKCIKIRALFDSGAQKSYISKRIAAKLGLKPVSNHTITHCLFGGIETAVENHKLYKFNLQDIDGKFECIISALDKEKVCGYLPKLNDRHIFKQLQDLKITLNDCESENFDIDLLIGADHSGFLFTGEVVQINDSLVAMKTRLGWVLQGSTLSTSVCTSAITHTATSFNVISQLWDLESIGIKDPAQTKNSEIMQKEIMNYFTETITINDQGRYQVNLPWKEDVNLLNNKELALKRLHSTTKRLISTGYYSEYDLSFKDWLDLGIIEQVNSDDSGHFLPHHAVIKESSLTTRVRPVFDASARDANGRSINSSLEPGLNLLELIPKLLIDFRKHAVGITADIKKAFLQISLIESDRKYLQFLWWADEERKKLNTYRHCRVVFGVTSSPFLLNATIRYHLESNNFPEYLKSTANKLKRSFYVDNCITSCSTHEDVLKFQKESKELMSPAKMLLRGWMIGPSENETILSTLGILWNTRKDTLYINLEQLEYIKERVTKRNILSIAHRIYDPIGYTAPIVLIPKLLLKKLHELKLGWDDDVPTEISDKFMSWMNKLKYLKPVHLPRRLTQDDIDQCKLSIHTFCDASKSAYAAAIFLRSQYKEKVSVQLVSAKTRLSPNKEVSDISIPRLELLAANIGTRLYSQVKSALCMEHDSYFWTDSNVVLSWIKNERDRGVFVKNRVREICNGTNRSDWHHIAGSLNPADLPSRGCHADVLQRSLWWEGPRWLKLDKEYWPISRIDDKPCLQVNDDLENVLVTAAIAEPFSDRLLYFSKYSMIKRIIAWILRFYNKVSRSERKHNDLEVKEIDKCEKILFKLIQTETYGDKKTYKDLCTIIDTDGLIRVKTKLFSEDIPSCYRFPILLPGSHQIVQRLVAQKHIALFHAGTQTLLANLRQNLWITGVRLLAKKTTRNCVTCRKHKGKACMTPLIPLPTNRTEAGKAFEVSGVDLAGPFLLRNGDKAWMVLYTCAVYRAIHLELVTSLSTNDFLLSFRRFIARRGRVTTMYSDHGTNFVGTRNLFKLVDWKEVKSQANIRNIKWILIPPGSPWWGGWYERMVRTVKEILRRVLGKASLTFIELETILVECEAIVNSRPLSYICDDVDVLSQPITPAFFLQPLSCTEVSDLDQLDAKSLNVRVKYLQKLRDDLKVRFRNEYLALLVLRGKEGHHNLKVGDIVLIETQEKRVRWPLGRIIELHVGRDGFCRVATIKTATGCYVVILEVQITYT